MFRRRNAKPEPSSIARNAISPESTGVPKDGARSKPVVHSGSEACTADSLRCANGQIVEGLYRLEKTIGKGSYGKVKLATNIQTKERVAVKFIAKSSIRKPSHWTRIRREINLLKIIHHPHIVRLLDHRETETDILIVLEYIPGADLFDRIVHHREQKFSERDARPIFRQIVSALDYCHQNRIIHRDLKPENLMLNDHNQVKLIDFGFANLYHPRGHLETNCGSPLYASPEIVQGVRYVGPEVDIWSLGVILYAMLTGTLPFEDDQLKGLYAKICAGSFTIPSYLSAGARELIRSMLTVDSLARATMQHIKYHPWVCDGMPFPPECFVPFRSTHAMVLSEDILQAMIDYGFPDIDATRNMIKNQNDSPAFAICCLLHERKQRELGKLQARSQPKMLTPPASPAKSLSKPYPRINPQPAMSTPPNAYYIVDDGGANPWVKIERPRALSPPAINCMAFSDPTGDSTALMTPSSSPSRFVSPPSLVHEPSPEHQMGSVGLVAQAAAHVANRFRKLRDLKFGYGGLPQQSSPLQDVEMGSPVSLHQVEEYSSLYSPQYSPQATSGAYTASPFVSGQK